MPVPLVKVSTLGHLNSKPLGSKPLGSTLYRYHFFFVQRRGKGVIGVSSSNLESTETNRLGLNPRGYGVGGLLCTNFFGSASLRGIGLRRFFAGSFLGGSILRQRPMAREQTGKDSERTGILLDG